MNYIVGDIGNTTTRICLLDNRFSIIKTSLFDTNKIYKNYTKKIIKKFLRKKTNNIILFSSVVPKAFNKIKKNFNGTKYKVVEIKSLNLKKVIKFNIKNLKQVGSDRIVNAIGGKKFNNCLIIDFGTATTFDIVKNKVYEGGVIAPGVKLSMTNLTKSTALLPFFSLKNSQKKYGKNTKEALNAGFLWGYEGLINNIIKKITSKWTKEYKIILTGGYASFFKKIIKGNTTVDQNITIKGISKVYKNLL